MWCQRRFVVVQTKPLFNVMHAAYGIAAPIIKYVTAQKETTIHCDLDRQTTSSEIHPILQTNSELRKLGARHIKASIAVTTSSTDNFRELRQWAPSSCHSSQLGGLSFMQHSIILRPPRADGRETLSSYFQAIHLL